ncbi:dUTP diphosphatase [Clostridium vincentii]|uniref:dUTPase n=1 Tax=Clostridium vincentii TaxID=52704 RepID=A0A2T0BE61_9CLOT|nr:dUTP diphosphatase [Clostridium vincentii]PRR82186.1 dUTPase [Clostridium vincentii]
MNITNLFKIQREISNELAVDSNLSDYKILARKNLELTIKISDLARATNCYKYWISDDPILDNNKIFEKYISCFIQIISLGLNNNYTDIEEVNVEPSEYCLSDEFINLFIDINDLIISPSKDHFITLLEDFLSLSINLDFSEGMVLDGFYQNSPLNLAL